MIQKNRFLFAGLPVIALALSMMVAGCDDGSIDDDSVPSELIGAWWYSNALIFTIDKHSLDYQYSSYKARASGKKITLFLFGNREEGTFEYSINSADELNITNGTGKCLDWQSKYPALTKTRPVS